MNHAAKAFVQEVRHRIVLLERRLLQAYQLPEVLRLLEGKETKKGILKPCTTWPEIFKIP